MNKIIRLLTLSLYVSFMVYAGCSGNDEPEPDKPFDCTTSDLAISLSVNGDVDPTSCAANDGSIQVLATGGKEPYKFAIGTGSLANASSFSGLGAGTFQITVQDANECTKKLNVTLQVSGAPTAVITDQAENTSCTAPFNGSITVSASGGSGTYEYKLDNNAFGTNTTFAGVSGGSHVITVRDGVGCTVTIGTTVPKGITGINYVNDVLPIFQAKCNFTGCHPDNGNWFIYSTAKAHAATIKDFTGAGIMPKGGSSAPGGALSANQIATIACWVDDGAPEN